MNENIFTYRFLYRYPWPFTEDCLPSFGLQEAANTSLQRRMIFCECITQQIQYVDNYRFSVNAFFC